MMPYYIDACLLLSPYFVTLAVPYVGLYLYLRRVVGFLKYSTYYDFVAIFDILPLSLGECAANDSRLWSTLVTNLFCDSVLGECTANESRLWSTLVY